VRILFAKASQKKNLDSGGALSFQTGFHHQVPIGGSSKKLVEYSNLAVYSLPTRFFDQ
jgi:hypothetical protein